VDGHAGAVHSKSLERAYGRIVAVTAMFTVLQFWSSSGALHGERPGSLTTDILLSLLLIGLSIWWAVRRPPRQRDLYCLAGAAGFLLPLSRVFATPGSLFLNEIAYLLVGPVVVAWAVFSRRLVVPVPVLLTVLATGAWHSGRDLSLEQSASTLAIVAFAGLAARLLRAGARRADTDADRLTLQMAHQDAALAASQAAQRAKSAVHDDVLSVLRAVNDPGQQVAWSILVLKAQQAQLALDRQLPGDGYGRGDLDAMLRRQAALSAAELHVRFRIFGTIKLTADRAEAVSAAVGEALRNVAVHARVDSATVTARTDGQGVTTVTVADQGAGFDPGKVRPDSLGLRHSIRGRLRNVGGSAEIISSPGHGTAIVLTLNPRSAESVDIGAIDPLAWARRLTPPPPQVFLGLMAPPLLGSLVSLCLRWQDIRWHAVAAAVFLGLLGLAAASAPNVSRVQMTHSAAVFRIAVVTVLTAAGTLAVRPGATDAFAYWASGESAVLITAIYFVKGPAFGLTAVALDIGALTAGLFVTGSGIPRGAWLTILASPVLAAGLAIGFRFAFRSLSRYTELRLREYEERQRRVARAEAIMRVDVTALENARVIAGPVLAQIVAGAPPSAALRSAAGLASQALRDELLAPGFVTGDLADQVRAARAAGVTVTVDIAREGGSAMTEVARRLLCTALIHIEEASSVTLQVHPETGTTAARLILHIRGSGALPNAALRECAREYGALFDDLDGTGVLVRLSAGTARSSAPPPKGG
jgi:hypothetical protein